MNTIEESKGIMKERGYRKTNLANPNEITFSELKEIIRQELLDLQKTGHLTLHIDDEGRVQSYCIAMEIEFALREED